MRLYTDLQRALVIASAVMTGLISLSYIYESSRASGLFKLLSLIISVAVVILASLIKTFNYQEKWVNYSIIYHDLESEIAHFYAGVGAYASADIDTESLFKSNVESILSRADEVWLAIHKPDRTQSPSPSNRPDNGTATAQAMSSQSSDMHNSPPSEVKPIALS